MTPNDRRGGRPGERPRRPFRLDGGAGRVERDVDAELEFHLARRARRLVDAGLDPATARERAHDRGAAAARARRRGGGRRGGTARRRGSFAIAVAVLAASAARVAPLEALRAE